MYNIYRIMTVNHSYYESLYNIVQNLILLVPLHALSYFTVFYLLELPLKMCHSREITNVFPAEQMSKLYINILVFVLSKLPCVFFNFSFKFLKE